MEEIKKSALIKCAKELNEKLGLDPQIDTTKKATVGVLKEGILEAAKLLLPDDELSEATMGVINALGAGLPKEAAEEKPAPPAEEAPEEDVAEEAGSEDPEEGSEEDDKDTPEEKAEEPKEEKKKAPPVKKVSDISGVLAGRQKTMTDVIDEVIVDGGSWDEIFANIKSFAKAAGVDGAEDKCTKGIVREHVRWRLKRGWVNVDLGGKIHISVTEDGIQVKKAK